MAAFFLRNLEIFKMSSFGNGYCIDFTNIAMEQMLHIEFDYHIDGLPKEIRLEAQVEQLSLANYIVQEVKMANGTQVLAPQRIEKIKNLWVDVDSTKETHLSQAIGDAIELALSKRSTAKSD